MSESKMKCALAECSMFFHQKEKQLRGLITEMRALDDHRAVDALAILDCDLQEVKKYRRTINSALGYNNVRRIYGMINPNELPPTQIIGPGNDNYDRNKITIEPSTTQLDLGNLADIAKLGKQVKDLTEDVEEKSKHIKGLNKELKKSFAENDKLQGDIRFLDLKVTDLQQDNKRMRLIIDKLLNI